MFDLNAWIAFYSIYDINTLFLSQMGNQISIASVVDYGDVNLTGISPYIGRDLGWSGSIGYSILNTYGDTVRATGQDYPDGVLNPTYPVAANSLSVGGGNPLSVYQPDTQTIDGQQYPNQWCDYSSAEKNSGVPLGLGLTAVQDVDGTNGVVFFFKIQRPDNTQFYVGAGIGKVDNSDIKHPKCTRLSDHYWDGQTEPGYGALGTFSGNDNGTDYIYAMGQGNTTKYGDYTWITRVQKAKALDTSQYQYWNGNAWTSKRLIDPTPSQAVTMYTKNGTVVPLEAQQASINWSNYYKAWIMADVINDGGVFVSTEIFRMRMSKVPQGPWSDYIVAFRHDQNITSKVTPSGNLTIGNNFYAFCQQPWYDQSGKSLLATFTYGASIQRLVNITFN